MLTRDEVLAKLNPETLEGQIRLAIAINIVASNQTPSERISRSTNLTNGVGFNKFDADAGVDLADKAHSWMKSRTREKWTLTNGQWNYIERLCRKYARQVTDGVNLREQQRLERLAAKQLVAA
jgi:hypothetical protein